MPKRWPASVAFLTSWWRPAGTASRLAHVSLWRAYAVHVVAVLLTALAILVLVGIADTREIGAIPGFLMLAARDLLDSWERHRAATLGTGLAIILSIEIGYVVLAAVTAPWGARDEPLRETYRNALRWTWLHTTHALPAVLVVGVFSISLIELERAWMAAYPIAQPNYPAPPKNAAQGSPAWQEQKAAAKEYWKKTAQWRRVVRRDKPLLLQNIEPFIAQACFLSVAWILWALLRGVGAPRHTPAMPRPPTCEACGYNLTGAPMDGRCPECGDPVSDSIGPGARPGTPWEHRHEVGFFAASRQCRNDAILRPRKLGRLIRLSPPGRDHKRFLLLHLLLIFLIGAGGVLPVAMLSYLARSPSAEKWLLLLTVVAPIAGFLTALVALGITLLGAGVGGVAFYRQDKRNLLAGSMQVACYLVGYVTAWVLLAWMMLAAVILMISVNLFSGIERRTGVDPDVLEYLTWCIPNVLCLVIYFALIVRGTAGLRYANR